MRKKLIILVVIAVSLGGSFFVLSSVLGKNLLKNLSSYTPGYVLKKQKPSATIGETKVFLDIAKTPSEKQKGLSGRTSLAQDEGMLFVWDAPTTPGFWMKDMNFAIDIIWIREGKVIAITGNAQPEPAKPHSELTLYYPPEPVTHVLEVNARFVDEHGIVVGDSVDFSNLQRE